MAKEYTIFEAWKMRNVEFIMTYESGKSKKVVVNNYGDLMSVKDRTLLQTGCCELRAVFRAVQKPVDFNKAIISEKRIKFCQHDLIDNNYYINNYMPVHEILKWIGNNYSDEEIKRIVNECKFLIEIDDKITK